MKKVLIYTDGSCLNNPGPGGWAAILALENSDYKREIYGGCRLTTNNRMEIMAAIQALQALNQPCEVTLFTDSQYLRNALEKGWLASWQKNAWRKADKKPVLNADLWRIFLTVKSPHRLSLKWLKGHAGHVENERCDFLARSCAQAENLPPDAIFEQSRETVPLCFPSIP